MGRKTKSELHTELRVRHMQLQRQKIDRWKKKLATTEAKRLHVKPEKVRILPWNTKAKLTLAHELVAKRVCPINDRMYLVVLDYR